MLFATRIFLCPLAMKFDSAVLKALAVDASDVSVSSAGSGDSSATASKISAKLSDGSTQNFFMKTGNGKAAEIMFRGERQISPDCQPFGNTHPSSGEHASLNAISAAVPSFCPKSLGHGKLADTANKYFLLTEYLDLSGRGSSSAGQSLAAKLARLHTTPAPTPDGFDKPMFGFPETTCCGDTPQPNDYSASWADFYAEKRLRFILRQSEKGNGPDPELSKMVGQMADVVVPRLLSDAHLNKGKGIAPVVVHGDLWSGNASAGKIGGLGETEQVVFDSSACYAHTEYDLGIMKMFGGFGASFFKEYHSLVPKTEPSEEYEDRIKLYELYHHLNHHAMFGGGYRSGAMSIMKGLARKYGNGVVLGGN